jgi:hypothetical protein
MKIKLKKDLYFIFIFIFASGYLHLSSCSTVSKDYMTINNQVDSVIHQMILTLEAGHYNEFVRSYLDPEFIKTRGGADEVFTEFDSDKRAELLHSLRIVQDVQPFLNNEKMEVTFSDRRLPRDLRMQKIAGKWYLLND